ncbi:MAG: DNA topoisomerase VI subunit B [Desulfurococcales archaeon]|nr:DNA topoisomerase VI subunit B [Desulfurococcales archaeon]
MARSLTKGKTVGSTVTVDSQEQYKQMNVAEFFAKNRQIAGFTNPTRAVYQTIRELVENSLDATDVYGILPTVYIKIEYDEELEEANDFPRKFLSITVEDNGVGVPPTVIANAFGRVLYSSKYVNRQTRGMYGLGVKAAVLYGQLTTGRPVEVVSSTKSSDYVYAKTIYIDIQKNEPRVVEEVQWRKRSGWHGTRVRIRLEGRWSSAKGRVLEYIRRTAIIAPYAEIYFETPEGEIFVFPRMTTKLPPPPKEAKPHPHGVDVEQMRMIISATRADRLYQVLVQEFQSVGEITAKRFLEEAGFDPNMNPKLLLKMKNELVRLVNAMKSYGKFRAPRSDHLSPIGEDLIVLGLRRMFNPDFAAAVTRTPKAYSGHSFIVEAGIAYGGGIPVRDEPLLLRYANKIPLLYEEKEGVIYKVVSQINWAQYNVKFPAPLVVLVHIASTRVPYKGVGKESIGDVPEIEKEIKIAVREVARKLRLYLSRKRREEEARKRIITISKYIPEIARSLATILKPPEKWEPPRPEEEEELKKALVRLVAKHIEIPKVDGREEEEPEKIVESVIEAVKVA